MSGRLRRLWVEMTTNDFQQTDMSQAIAILPVAAIEQHGPHLPVEVDAAINRGVLARAMELLPADLPVTFPAGDAHRQVERAHLLPRHAHLVGRDADPAVDRDRRERGRAGVRKLVLFNSHGGQPQIADIVARDLRVRRDMFVVTASSYALGRPAGLSRQPSSSTASMAARSRPRS